MRLNGKKVLITGADGFIGSHLTEKLLSEGAEITALVYYNSFNTYGWLDTIDSKLLNQIQIIPGDIRDPNQMRSLVRGKDIVFHLAALIGIPFSYSAPDLYVDTNIKGTLNILQACREFSVEKVLITSTSEVYGTALSVPISEQHPLQGQSPYSASKIGADKIAESFYLSFQTPIVIVRPFNTYGPRQSTRAVIPTIITQLVSGNYQIKLGSLTPTRDFVFVKDTAEAFIKLSLTDNIVGEVVNISTGMEISIMDLVNNIKSKLGIEFEILSDLQRLRPIHSEVERLLGDNSKLKSKTNWVPSTSLDEGLDITIEWFKEPTNLNHYKIGTYTV